MSERFEEQEFNTDHLDTKLWSRILKHFFVYKKDLTIIFVSMFSIACVDIAFPFLNKLAIDYFVLEKGDLAKLWPFGLVYGFLILVQVFVVYFFIKYTGKVEMQFAYDIRNQAFKKLQELSFSYYDKTPQGWIMARMTSDIGRLADIVSWSIIDLIWGSTLIIGVSIVMLIVNWRLALLVLVVVPFLAYISIIFQKKILQRYRLTRKINSKITASYSEGILGAKTTKTMGLEEQQSAEFRELTYSMKSESVKAAVLSAAFMPIVMGLGAFSSAMLIWLGGQQVLVGTIAFGTLVLFTQYASQFFEPLRQIARLLAEFQMAQASAERVLSLLNADVDLVDREDVIEKYGSILEPKTESYEKVNGDVEFENVNFFYKEEEPVLVNFNLKVNAGETIALVGETGSGKSTIVNLICRFYEPKSGMIKIDGVDTKDRSLGWLHSNLGYVLQAPHLFSGTIKENIRYGDLSASDEAIVEAAKRVSAHDFIMNMEEGYDTEVGEGGGRLSTGQKQLISFARAILANPSIFILDEASSSIDTETEQIIQIAIESVLHDKTTFIIAHRLSTIVNADRILLIDKGRIVEDGTHSQLMHMKGRYYRLYTNQFNEDRQNELLQIKGEKAYEA
jgi:ATP-binding cassette, subfamily B, bacterial